MTKSSVEDDAQKKNVSADVPVNHVGFSRSTTFNSFYGGMVNKCEDYMIKVMPTLQQH